jgi:hypothetical protein
MNDSLVGMAVIGFYIGSFAIWCYGVAACLKTAEYFWAVFSFALPPVGFLIGLYNLIF